MLPPSLEWPSWHIECYQWWVSLWSAVVMHIMLPRPQGRRQQLWWHNIPYSCCSHPAQPLSLGLSFHTPASPSFVASYLNSKFSLSSCRGDHVWRLLPCTPLNPAEFISLTNPCQMTWPTPKHSEEPLRLINFTGPVLSFAPAPLTSSVLQGLDGKFVLLQKGWEGRRFPHQLPAYPFSASGGKKFKKKRI